MQMRKKLRLALVSVPLLAVCCACSVDEDPHKGASRKSERPAATKGAWSLAGMKDDAQAEAALSALVARGLERREAACKAGLDDRQIVLEISDELLSFAESRNGTRAALTARFLAGVTPWDLGGILPAEHRRSLERISHEHPGTPEGALAKCTVLARLAMHARASQDSSEAKRPVADFRRALEAVLPFAKRLDEDEGHLSSAIKGLILRGKKELVLPGLRLDIARTTRELGETEKAEALYQDVIRDYPGTRFAREAKESVADLKGQGSVFDDGTLDSTNRPPQ